MRDFMKLVESALEEAPKAKVKDPTTHDMDFADPTSKGELTAPAAAGNVAARPGPANLPGKRASKERSRSVGAAIPPEGQNYLAALHRSAALANMPDVEPDETEFEQPEPPTPETLPALINTAVANTGEAIQPEWHMVKNLPGYMQRAIRQMGRAIFEPFTDTPIDQIQVLSTLSNPEGEVAGMARWIMNNGQRDDQAELEFSDIMPGYSAQTQIWNTNDCTFMVVRDFAGTYIYGWPGGRGTQIDSGPEMRQIR